MVPATRVAAAGSEPAADAPRMNPQALLSAPPAHDALGNVRDLMVRIPGGRRLHGALTQSAILVLLRHTLGGTFPWGVWARAVPTLTGFRLPSKYAADLFHTVVVADEYGVRHVDLDPGDVVIDVGAHIGSFTALAHQLGSRRIVACEANPRVFSRLQSNVRRMRGVHATHAAIGRCDVSDGGEALISDFAAARDTVLFDGDYFDFPTRHHHPAGGAAVRCPLLAFDRVLERYPRVRLLKLDCEGSEFPILLTSRLLERVELIVGEYHEVPPEHYRSLADYARVAGIDRYEIEQIVGTLTEKGFRTAVYPVAASIGLFAAWRTDVGRS